MSEKIKEIWKRKLIESEDKARESDKEWAILITILNEINKKTNPKLNSILDSINLEEDISYLGDWKEFYSEQIENYTKKLNGLKEKAAEKSIERLEESLAKEAGIKSKLGEETAKEPEKIIVEKEHMKILLREEANLNDLLEEEKRLSEEKERIENELGQIAGKMHAAEDIKKKITES